MPNSFSRQNTRVETSCLFLPVMWDVKRIREFEFFMEGLLHTNVHDFAWYAYVIISDSNMSVT